MNQSDNWVIVGRFGKPNGLKGLVAIHSFTEPYDNITTYSDLHVFNNKQWQPLKVINFHSRATYLLADIEGIDDRDKAALLTNLDIAIPRESLPALPPGEFYWDQLIGMSVINKQHEPLGTVADIMATGSNDVLVVVGEKRHLIPYLLNDFIIEINAEEKRILVDWDKDF